MDGWTFLKLYYSLANLLACKCCHILKLCFLLTVYDVLPLVINNMDMRLPASLMQKYMLKAAEFYIGYVTRGPSPDGQMQGKALSMLLFAFWVITLHPNVFLLFASLTFLFCSHCFCCIRVSRGRLSEVTHHVPWLPALRDRRPVREVVGGGRAVGEAAGHPGCGRSPLRVAGRQRTEVVYESICHFCR